MNKFFHTFISYLKKNKYLILVLLLFIISSFFRFYDLEGRNQFTWDQVDNAWMAKNILVDHRFPLLGMQAKLNSGFSIGPLYYYFIIPFYWFFHLDPIASGFIAGITSMITFFVVYFVFKKMFSFKIALLAIFFCSFSMYIIELDRIQWPVNFIAPISLLIFYFLHKVMLGQGKYLLLVALFLGVAFNIHFTAIFFLIAILLCVPFFPKKKSTIFFGLISLSIVLLFLLPNIYVELTTKNSSAHNLLNYLHDYYHGFHLTRVRQIAFDAFIEFEGLLSLQWLRYIEFFLPLIFIFLLWKKEKKPKAFVITYLTLLWIIIPWFAFATYKGEISNYYFSMTRPITLMVFSYLLGILANRKNKVALTIGALILVIFAFINMQKFFTTQYQGLGFHRAQVIDAIKNGKKIDFVEGMPESYIYYVYTHQKNN